MYMTRRARILRVPLRIVLVSCIPTKFGIVDIYHPVLMKSALGFNCYCGDAKQECGGR
jgi:hypothetical protein